MNLKVNIIEWLFIAISFTLLIRATSTIAEQVSSHNSISSEQKNSLISSELDDHIVIEISSFYLNDIDQISKLLDLDVWEVGTDDQINYKLTALIDSKQFRLLEAIERTEISTIKLTILNANIKETVKTDMIHVLLTRKMYYQQKSNGDTEDIEDYLSIYHTYDEIKSWYQSLAAQNPEVVHFEPSIGKTHENRDIFALRINRTPIDSNKKQIWVQSLIHAREWISGPVAQYIAFKMTKSTEAEIGYDLFRSELIIIPVVNPDGYVYSWEKNRLWRKNRNPLFDGSGVDLNRNFEAKWGDSSNNPFSECYQGVNAASEPETQSIQRFYSLQKNLVGVIDLHSYSQLILYPFGYSNKIPVDIEKYDSVTRLIRDSIKSYVDMRFEKYREYDILHSFAMYPTTGTAMDWFIGDVIHKESFKYRPLSLTIELPPKARNNEGGFLIKPHVILPTALGFWRGFRTFASYSLRNCSIINSNNDINLQISKKLSDNGSKN